MRKIVLMLFVVASSPLSSPAQKLDKYGGLSELKCSAATGWFHTEKIDSKWWLCTPSGNRIFIESIGPMAVPQAPKYGCSSSGPCAAAANALFDEIRSWNFNAIGNDSYGAWTPYGGSCGGSCRSLPQLMQDSAGEYSTINLNDLGFAPHPVKDLSLGVGDHYANSYINSFLDYFDPNFPTFLTNYFSRYSGAQGYRRNPDIIGLAVDGADNFYGVGAGPDFDTFPPGKTNSDLAYMVLLTSPVQTFNPCSEYRCQRLLYSDTKLYSKTAMANPPGACSVATPCSLRDYLYKKYNGSISALNTAWGSNYTTFDSSGTQITGEIVATGDGKQVQFSHHLASGPVSKRSVQLFLNGNLVAADCPGCDVPTGQASFAGAVGPSKKGFALIHGITPWLSGIDCAGSGSMPSASYWVVITYHFANQSAYYASPSLERKTTSCSSKHQVQVYGADGATGSHPNPGSATGVDVYASCQVSHGAPEGGCVGTNDSSPAPTLQATNVPIVAITAISVSDGIGTATVNSTAGIYAGQAFTIYGTVACDQNHAIVSSVLNLTQFTYHTLGSKSCGSGGTVSFGWTVPATGLVKGASVPTAPSYLTYASGEMQLRFAEPLPKGLNVTINYVSNGWGLGTGLMDEDGRNARWIGSNAVCLLPVADPSKPGTDSYACRPNNQGGYSAPDANLNLAADLTAWDAQFVAQYFGSVRSALKASNPNLLYFGIETLGTWGAPPSKEILKAANQYVDVLYTAWWANRPSVAVADAEYSYYSRYFSGPMINLTYLTACPDSPVATINPNCGGVPYQDTQVARGKQYSTIVQSMLSKPSYNHTYQWIGTNWWQLHDCDGPDNPVNNWGLKTCRDNAYDGHEAVTEVVSCSPPLEKRKCGGERGNYGDVITLVKEANGVWIQTAETTGPPSASNASR